MKKTRRAAARRVCWVREGWAGYVRVVYPGTSTPDPMRTPTRRRERARASDKIMRLRYARCATMSIERSEKKASGISKGSLGSQQEDEAGGVAGIRCQLDHAERGDAVGAVAAQFVIEMGLA